MLYVVENKTAGEDIGPAANYWRRLILDPQVSMYVTGTRHLGFDVGGVMFNVLRKLALQPYEATPPDQRKYTKPTKAEPVPRLYANQRDRDETPEEFEQRCIDAIAEEPARYYQRRLVVRLRDDLHEANVDVWQTAGAIRDARRLAVWPRNPDSCLHFGRACDFFSACSGEQSIDDPVLFRTNPRRHEELDEEGDDVLTQSSIRCYRACPRKFYLRYELRKRRLAETPEPLRMGKSIHRALETWWKTGSLDQSLALLDRANAFLLAKERAMMRGYHIMWSDQPRDVVSVEKQWFAPLINPETGAQSKTFRLSGRTDVLIEAP